MTARDLPASLRRALTAPPAWTALGVGAVAIAVYFLLPAHGDTQSIFYVAIGTASVLAILAGTIRNLAPGERLAWYLFAAGLACQVVGDAIFAVYEVQLDREPPTVSIADAAYLGGYPLLALGIFLAVRRLGGHVSRAAILDTLVVFFGVALVQWVFFIDPFNHQSGSLGSRLVHMAYPAMDVLLLVGLAQLFAGRAGRRSPAYLLLLASVALWVVADEIYGLHPGRYAGGDWIDALWLGSYVTWAAAALHPSVAGVGRPDRRSLPRLTAMRLLILAAALLVAPAVLLTERLAHHKVHSLAIAGGAAAIAVVVLVRLSGLLRGLERARASERLALREAEQAQHLLRLQNERLRELDHLKSEFVSSVTHELRTPLTSISGYVQLMLEDEPSELKQSYLGIIDRNATRLLALISDILFSARLQDGTLELDLEPVDVALVVAESVAAARPRAEAAGVQLTLHDASSGVAHVRGQADRLHQLLDNLVSNAIKFTPVDGRVDVRVATGGATVQIEVADTGMGVSPSDAKRVFERFFRADSAFERQIQGTGLGLYISRAIVEAHGGQIAVRSVEGEGATFSVELPAAR